MAPKFRHYDLELVEPDFGSTITDLIIDLDYLRRKEFLSQSYAERHFFCSIIISLIPLFAKSKRVLN